MAAPKPPNRVQEVYVNPGGPVSRLRLLLASCGVVVLILALAPLSLGDEGRDLFNQPQVSPLAATPGFRIEGRQVVGTNVAFGYAPEAGPILNYTYLARHEGGSQPEPIFQAILIPGYQIMGQPAVIGSLFMADGGVANLTVHDNPEALVGIGARGALQVTFLLAPGAEVESGDSDIAQGHTVLFDKPLRAALFSAEGTMVLDGNRVAVTLTGPGSVLFRAMSPAGHGNPGEEDSVSVAIAEQRVGAAVSIELTADGPRVDPTHYRKDLRVDVARVARHHLGLRVRGDRSEGTRLLLRLDPSVAPVDDLGGLKVSLDGVPISRGSLTDVLYAWRSGPSDARYAALVQGPGFGIVAYIPRLSPQGVELTIDATPPFTLVIDTPALEIMGIGVAVVALATLALFRRRR